MNTRGKKYRRRPQVSKTRSRPSNRRALTLRKQTGTNDRVLSTITNSPMRPLRYSINVTLDGCCDHREMIADEDLHRNALENIERADALLFGRVTYEMMETGWRRPAA